MIMAAPCSYLQERGLHIDGHKLRQTNLGGYGISDILFLNHLYDDRYRVYVMELKKGEIGIDTFFQAIKYAKGIMNWCSIYRRDINIDVHIVLIGSSIQKDTGFVYLADLFPSVSLYTFKIEYNGIKFNPHHGYVATYDQFERYENKKLLLKQNCQQTT